MTSEIATLNSEFVPRLAAVRLAIRGHRPEGIELINRVFYDVLRHFRFASVAKRRHSNVGIALLALAWLGGCATGSGFGGLTADTPAEAKQSAVAVRAKARWEALIKLDIASAYEYLSPASKATMPLDLYRAKHKLGLYRAVKVDGVSCAADACTVNLSVTYDYKSFKGMTTPLVEKWIITQGQAWFVEQG
jgi:hypothetical protein